MVVLSPFPGGVLQVTDVITNGYWHARSLAYTATPLTRTLEWLRLPGDVIFILSGSGPVAVALLLSCRHLWSDRLKSSGEMPMPRPTLVSESGDERLWLLAILKG